MDSVLNRDLLRDNECFGCGLENPVGLRIEIRRDPLEPSRLCARFTPSARMAGFPGITHGGAIYGALDCLSTWIATLLGPNRQAGWILRSANTTYRKPVHIGQPVTLVGWIAQQAGAWDPITVRTEARRADGLVCVEAEFKVVPLPTDRLAGIAGVEELPRNWEAFLSGAT